MRYHANVPVVAMPALPANLLLSNPGFLRSEHAEEILLPFNADMYPANYIDFIYFPTSAMISIACRGLAVGTIGNEGMLGGTVLLGGDEPLGKNTVVMRGMAVRVPVASFRDTLEKHPEATAILYHYISDLMAQIMQGAGCSRLHTIKQRCARWLLNAQDCVGCEELLITQEHLAQLLGVRRPTINSTLTELRREGLIRHKRGRVTIINRPRLADTACECHGLIRNTPQ